MEDEREGFILARERFVHYLDLAIYYGFLFLVFAIPLIFLPYSYSAYTQTKVTFLQILTILLLAGWLAKQLLSNQIQIRRTRSDIPILIFLAVVGFSTFTSIHLPTSIFGRYQRYEGLITLTNYALIFFLATQTFSNIQRIRMLRETIILTTIPVAIYGLVQYFGYDFIVWSEGVFPGKRSFSTLGNPIFLAGYLVLVFPLIFSKYFESAKSKHLFLYGTATLLVFTSIITTLSRGGWLAFLAGLLALVLLLGKKVIFSRRTGFLILTLALTLLFMFIVSYRVTLSSPKNTTLIERVRSLPKISEGSSYSRLLIWQSALKMWFKRPLLGWGPDTFQLVFPSFESLKYARLYGREIADNTHNYFLQLASTLGLLGFLSFLVILSILLWQSRKLLLLKDNNHIFYGALIASIIGYLTYLLFGINDIGIGPIFWIIAGLISIQASDLRTSQLKWPSSALSFRLIVVFLISLLAFAGIFFSIKLYFADVHFAQAQWLSRTGHFNLAINEYKSAIRLNPYQDLYQTSLGIHYALESKRIKSKPFFDKAVDLYLEAQKANPAKSSTPYLLGSLYLHAGGQFSPYYYALAEKQLQQALQIRPYSPEAHGDLGIIYFKTSRFPKALSEFKAVLKIDSQNAQAYLYLGKSYEALDNFSKARQAYQSVLKLEPANKEAKEGLGRIEGEGRRANDKVLPDKGKGW